MTTLREAAQQALEALEGGADSWQLVGPAIDALKAALVEDAMQKFTDVNQELMAALGCDHCNSPLYAAVKCRVCGRVTEPVQEPKPVEFDHGIGADRFKVVRGAFWWHVLIGDSPTEHGKFRSRASAEKMAADLLREFRNGAFVQHEAALAEPVQEPVQDGKCKHCVDGCPACDARKLPVQEPVAWMYSDDHERMLKTETFCTVYSVKVGSPDKGVTDVPLYAAPPQRVPLTREEAIALWADKSDGPSNGEIVSYCRAIERAHGITS